MVRKIPDDVPRDLPRAKLFLDDVEEVAELLKGAQGSQKGADTDVKFRIGNYEYDSIEELQQRGGSTSSFSIDVGRYSLTVGNYSTTWYGEFGLDRSAQWQLYGQLRHIFSARRKKLASLLNPNWTGFIMPLFLAICIYPPIALIARKLGSPIGVAHGLGISSYAIAFFLWIKADRNHSTIVLRHSYDRSLSKTLRENGVKIAVAVISSLITLASTLLIQHFLVPKK